MHVGWTNPLRDPQMRREPYTVADFMPQVEAISPPERTAADVLFELRAAHASFNAKRRT